MGSSRVRARDLAAAVAELKQLILTDLPIKIDAKLEDLRAHLAASDTKQDEVNKNILERLNKMEEKIRMQDDRSRRNNLIFKGITDSVSETWAESEIATADFGAHFGLFESSQAPRFDRVHRLGAFRQGQSRPIIARLTFYKDKAMILAKAKILKDSTFSIYEDFSP